MFLSLFLLGVGIIRNECDTVPVKRSREHTHTHVTSSLRSDDDGSGCGDKAIGREMVVVMVMLTAVMVMGLVAMILE